MRKLQLIGLFISLSILSNAQVNNADLVIKNINIIDALKYIMKIHKILWLSFKK